MLFSPYRFWLLVSAFLVPVAANAFDAKHSTNADKAYTLGTSVGVLGTGVIHCDGVVLDTSLTTRSETMGRRLDERAFMAGLRAGVMEFREYVKQLGSEEAACNWVVKDYNEKFGHPVFGFGVMPENQQYVNELNEEPSK